MKPHDAVFKKVFSVPEVALDYLRAELPADLWQQLRPETLRLVSGSFVTPSLREYFSDVLYSAELELPGQQKRQPLTISFLFEHKSGQPECIHQQIGLYQFSVWSHQQDRGRQLTPIVPMVIYHGEAPWRTHSFADCFPTLPDSVKEFVPSVKFYLTNLHNLAEAEINQRYHALSLQVLFQLLQAAFREEQLAKRFDDILQGLVRVMDANPGSDMGKAMFTYLMSIANTHKMPPQKIISSINRLPPNAKTMFESVYDAVWKEGHEKGLEKGLEKGREEGRESALRVTAEKCLKLGMSVTEVVAITDLSAKEVKEIAKRLKL